MSTITDFFDSIWEFFHVTVWGGLKNFASWVFESFQLWGLESATDLVTWIGTFIQYCTQATGQAFSAFESYWDGMPDMVLGVLTLTQVPAALCMMFAAFVVRVTIRVILAVVF